MNETNTTTLPIHITPHHLSLSPAVRDFACKKVAKVPRFANDVLAADIVLRRHHGTADGKRFSASARLAVTGRDIHASAAHADIYTAIVKMVTRLARRSRKRKTRLAKTHSTRRGATLHHARRSVDLLNAPRVAGSDFSDSRTRSEMRHPRRRAGGQEQRVFGFRRTSPFAFHEL